MCPVCSSPKYTPRVRYMEATMQYWTMYNVLYKVSGNLEDFWLPRNILLQTWRVHLQEPCLL